jgi:hypothetical protein
MRASPPIPGGSGRRALAPVLVLVAGVLAACSSGPSTSGAGPTTSTTKAATPATCPLRGTPVPGGGPVPARPALAVKVDNYPAARPQSGLDKADIVFEEPVEGAITRYAAVFQCQGAALVGPVRSARNIDIGILSEFGAPLLAHVGGINPVIANIEASPIVNVDLGDHASVIQHLQGRYAPYNTYTSTAALWALHPGDTTPPAPVFTYAAASPAGTAVRAVSIPFSSTSQVVWRWDRGAGRFERFYGTRPDTLADGVQNSATNMVVQQVHLTYGPWLENSSSSSLEVQANLDDQASGPAEIYRNGTEITATWHRDEPSQATQFLTAQGQPVPLAPGTTWVELVPDTVTVTPTPAPTAPGAGA